MVEFEQIVKQSKHWDGFEREKALHLFSERKDPRAIPFLLIRLNDWVHVIRELAAKVLDGFLTDEFAETWINNLGNVDHLLICARRNHAPWIRRLKEFLVENHSDLVVQALMHPNRDVSRICSKLIVENNLMADFIVVGLAHPDSIIRRKAIDQVRSLEGRDKMPFLRRAMKDVFGPIRREAFYQLRETNLSNEFLKGVLFDRSPAVRDLAKQDLLERNVKVREIFDRVIKVGASNQILGFALLGIGKDLRVADFETLRPFLNHQSVVVRRHALTACVDVLDADSKAVITTALQDSSRAVRKNAAQMASKLKTFSVAEDLLAIVDASPASFRVCLGIAVQLGRWERLIFLLCVVKRPDFSEEDSKTYFEKWHADSNKSFLDPSERQMKVIRENHLNYPNKELAFVMKTF